MLRNLIAPGMALTILFGTACTIKGSGTQRERYNSESSAASGDATPDSGEEDFAEEDTSAACLKLAEKRKKNLKLQDEGEDEFVEEPTEEEISACEEEPVDEEIVDEEEPAEE